MIDQVNPSADGCSNLNTEYNDNCRTFTFLSIEVQAAIVAYHRFRSAPSVACGMWHSIRYKMGQSCQS